MNDQSHQLNANACMASYSPLDALVMSCGASHQGVALMSSSV